MQLKSIEITGFKSFPEKTKIDFHRGMTAIVGPNGSGKSNITDAIRWVLGEQNAKVLRGKKMEDLIFSGTQNRRQMGYAEVSLIFDNHDQTLDLPYDEVKFSRRLYRSGESEYRINQQNCRLKDIQKLILDTGVGRSGYAIVGQGRVDEILSPKSEDRRHVFDEASGISKFRIQRDESQKKLDEAMYNLARVQDILGEMEVQLEPLKVQAKVAQTFLTLQQDKKDLEQVLCMKAIEMYEEHLNNEGQKLLSLEKQEKDLQEELQQVTQELQLLKIQLEELKTEEEAFQQERLQDIALREQLKGQQALSIQEESNLLKTLNYLEALQQEKQEEQDKILQELEEKEKKRSLLVVQKEKLNTEYMKRTEELERFVQALDEQAKSLEILRASILEKQDIYFEKRTLYSEASSFLKALDLQIKEKRSTLQHVLVQKDALVVEFETHHLAYQSLEKQVADCELSYKQAEEHLNQSRARLENYQKEEAFLNQHIQNLQYKQQTLEQLSKNYEGYLYAVKSLLTYKGLDHTQKAKIKGPVAELIQVKPKFEIAIDIALGALQQNVVVDDQDTAKYCIDLLKKEHLGRATFLPLKQLYFKPVEAEQYRLAQTQEGFLGLASEHIQLEQTLEPLAEFLLGRCFIVEDLEQAKALSKKLKNKAKIVTLDGDLIQPGGAMTGGSLKEKQSKLLSRKNQMLQLDLEQQESQRKIKKIKDAAYQENQNFQSSLKAFEQLIVEKKTLESDFSTQKIEHEHQKRHLNQLKDQIEKVKAELSVLEQEHQKEKQKEQLNFEAAENIQQDIKRIRQTLEQDEEKNKTEVQYRETLREELSDLKFSLQSMEESLQHQTENLQQLKNLLEQSAAKEDKNLEERQNVAQALEANRLKQASLHDQIQKQSLKESEQEQRLTYFSKQHEKLENQMEQRLLEEKTLIRKWNQIENETQKWKSLQDSLLDKLSEKRSFLWENYALTFEQSLEVLKNETHPPRWANLFLNTSEKDRTALEKRVVQYQKEIEALGPVNIGAIEAEKLLQERYQFLKQQAEDLILSKTELEHIIRDLTEDMKRIFLESFSKINERFNESFKALFGGGMASLELENQQDPLETNIEIKVCPPGKRLQNMLLLSGGEKALSAIALLFAILQLRPSPFVILDEIEAALDEANVHRFAHYVKDFALASQFILVTHRKGTMEACERIYGVTMQEKGVSRILSLKLSESLETESFLKELN